MLVAWRSEPHREAETEDDGPPVRDQLLTLMPANTL
jgi:hypothetical protein